MTAADLESAINSCPDFNGLKVTVTESNRKFTISYTVGNTTVTATIE